MGKVRILEIKESVFADNDRQADQLRIRLKEKGVFLMNLMSSPGSGKTTTLKRTIAALKDDLRIGVMEADISLNVVQKLEKLLCALPEKYYNIGLSRIYELAEKYPKPYRHLMRSVNNGWEQAEKYLEKGMEEGMIREVSIPVVMAMVKGTVYCFMESDILYQNELTYEQAKKEMVEILMKGIKVGGKSKDSGN